MDSIWRTTRTRVMTTQYRAETPPDRRIAGLRSRYISKASRRNVVKIWTKLLKLRYDVHIAPMHSQGPTMWLFNEICDFEIEAALETKTEHLLITWSKLIKLNSHLHLGAKHTYKDIHNVFWRNQWWLNFVWFWRKLSILLDQYQNLDEIIEIEIWCS